MHFELSECVALQSEDPKAAASFYTEVLGFPMDGDAGVAAIDAGPLTLFVDEQKHCSGLLMELLVEDVEAAREYLEANGCEVVSWGGAGHACIIRDPFGVHYNIFAR